MSYTQRETPILAALCTFLVEDVYGELAARVYSVLARHGRQTLAAIARASYLNGRQIKYGLVILLQQHLIFASNHAPVTCYEIDWQNSYALVRVGRVSKLVEDRFGKKASNVISNLLNLGHTRIADLKDAYFPPATDSDHESDGDIANGAGMKRKRVTGTEAKTKGVVNGVPANDDAKPSSDRLMTEGGPVNGVAEEPNLNGKMQKEEKIDSHQGSTISEAEDEIASVDDLDDTIRLLMEKGWIRIVTEDQYFSPGDVHTIKQQEAINNVNGGAAATGTKDKEKVHRETLRLKREMRDAWSDVPKLTRKRQAEDSHYNGANKRQKINGVQSRSGAVTSSSEDEVVIRVNPEKISVAMRTEQLVQLVEQRIGQVTAQVYRAMLRVLEDKIPRCYEEWPEPPMPVGNGEAIADNYMDPSLLVTAQDIARKLDRDIDICEGLDPHIINGFASHGHVRGSNALSTPVDPSKLSRDQRTEVVDKHIQLLAAHPLHFATWHSRSGFSQWHVEFEEIAKHMIQHEIENTISARKGALGVKLIRALRKKGKLDERATCNAMMMSANDVRGIVNDLTVQGFVQTQEIPKVERREAKLSLHFVWYDRQRAREKLLHDTYKGMVRILQRIAYEREKVQPVLSKAERSDVVGKEDKYLSGGELDILKKWKEVQEKLVLQLFREDDLVATLRDFHGALISV